MFMSEIQIPTISEAPSAPIIASERSDYRRIPAAGIDQPAALSDQLDALAKLPTNTLRQQWSRLYRSQPPPRMSRDLLLLAVSWKVQARALGGLGASAKRKLADMARKSNSQERTASAIRLKPGTKLIREWHGDIHEILVLEDGFEWCGCHYRSLTQIAFQITGAHWSGPRFFGLKAKQDNFAKTNDRNAAIQETEALDTEALD
jgi:hypothetical protein